MGLWIKFLISQLTALWFNTCENVHLNFHKIVKWKKALHKVYHRECPLPVFKLLVITITLRSEFFAATDFSFSSNYPQILTLPKISAIKEKKFHKDKRKEIKQVGMDVPNSKAATLTLNIPTHISSLLPTCPSIYHSTRQKNNVQTGCASQALSQDTKDIKTGYNF